MTMAGKIWRNVVLFSFGYVIFCITLTMTGCATDQPKAHDYCANDKPVKFHSQADIDALPDYLSKEIDAHNAAYRKACGKN